MTNHEIDSCGFGLLIDLNNQKSAKLVQTALEGLTRLSHRGAIGEDGLSGDGCGIMLQLNKPYFKQLAAQDGIKLTDHFAVGMFFLNQTNSIANRSLFEEKLKQQGFTIAGWRDVPIDLQYLANHQNAPLISQIFIHCPEQWPTATVEKNLFIAKQRVFNSPDHDKQFSVCSLSCQTIVYKALVLTQNLKLFFPDLQNDRFQSAVALIHQRFSTNTLPSWHLAQPFSILAHNGEINTIQGNRHYAQQLSHQFIHYHFPTLEGSERLINTQGSDSLSMDNLLECHQHAGFSSAEALRLMMPPAWENRELSEEEKSYYRYHALHLPPWEGPAGIVFFDGRFAGCILDRNGFRPARLCKTTQNWLGIGSEIGLFDFKEEEVSQLSQLKPGELLVIDTETKELIDCDRFMANQPFAKWMTDNSLTLEDSEQLSLIASHKLEDSTLKRFDLSFEEREQVLRQMAESASEATASMGDDTPIAALSINSRQLFDFFRQQFAQVTNPPIDSLREKSVISNQTYLGNQGLVTQRNASYAEQIALPSPLLTKHQLNALQTLPKSKFQTHTISLAYAHKTSLKQAVNELCSQIHALVIKQHVILILSDEDHNENQCTIHPAIAIGAVHQHLIRNHRREYVSLIIQSAWIRDAHHVAMSVACGANAVYPWLAYQFIAHNVLQKQDDGLQALYNYRKALNKGLLKICSKMGVCTINSYRGAQLFHVMGLSKTIMDDCFSQASFWLEKYDWDSLDQQQKMFYQHSLNPNELPRQGGLYKYTPQGEHHDYNPEVVTSLLRAVNEGDARYYQQFKELVNGRPPVMVRDFLQLKCNPSPIDIKTVEPIAAILKRFDTAAMSLGALAPEAHEALAIAMNKMGGYSNSGEGGEASYRQGQVTQSKIKQVASARFGVTAAYLMHAEVIQIKIAQGAKPGEGGQLPGKKVNALIAELRFCSPGVELISPPPHHDIYSIEDLAQLIFDLKQINPEARVSVKLVAAPGVGTIAAGVVKAYADKITISGYDGGTGASPLSSVRYTGCPWELGLIETQQVLLANQLRHRVTLQVDGGLKTGLDVIKAALLGAESFGFGTAPMIALGCKYLRICHLNNCATGIATQDERLRSDFYTGKPEKVMRYFQWVAEEVREWLAQLGFTSLQEIIGRKDLLDIVEQQAHGIGKDLSKLLDYPDDKGPQNCYQQSSNPPFDRALLAQQLLADMRSAIDNQHDFSAHYRIANHNRSIGANLAGEIAKRYGNKGFQGHLHMHFQGIAGQSLGAWMVQGMCITLEGAANDYVGKGMNGGELIIKPFSTSKINPRQSSLAGNTCLYGATGGLCFINGLTGQRFAVRNSGATAVVQGVGEHACEYMTAGTVVILSTPGPNFAAGMTGGVAFVYDDLHCLTSHCNPESVSICALSDPKAREYQQQLSELLKRFYGQTQCQFTGQLLENMEKHWSQFYLVLPHGHGIQPMNSAEVQP